MNVLWRLASLADFHAIQNQFRRVDDQRVDERDEATALEAQRLIRTHFPDALKNSRQWDWRALVGCEADGRIVAVALHREAPDWLSPVGVPSAFPPGVHLRLLVACAIDKGQRAHGTEPRLSDELMAIVTDDARRRAPADQPSLLVTRVHRDNHASRAMLLRNGFRPVPALDLDPYGAFALVLRGPRS